MSELNDESFEDPLEKLLDLESDEEFGLPLSTSVIASDAAHSSIDLKHWTAEEFSKIFIRYQPNLIRHAKRYISDSYHAEEIVQDAFLYLMTALPALDSEEGVLRSLKWKVRLLCLDSYRTASRKRESSLQYPDELLRDDEYIGQELERAEDLAVIKMALAKLSPRHREAVIADVYEEQNTVEIGERLGLNENATRQLLFRARRAFRVALVGEATVAGKTASEILSIAAKRAAKSLSENSSKIGAFLVFLSVGTGALFGQLQFSSSDNLAQTADPIVPQRQAPESSPVDVSEGVAATPISPNENSRDAIALVELEQSASSYDATEVTTADEEQTESQSGGIMQISEDNDTSLSRPALERVLSTDVSEAGIYQDSYAIQFSNLFRGKSIEVFGGTGISAFVDLDTEAQSINTIIFQIQDGEEKYIGVARESVVEALSGNDHNGLTLVAFASSLTFVDQNGRVFEDNEMSDIQVVVSLELDDMGDTASASLVVSKTKESPVA